LGGRKLDNFARASAFFSVRAGGDCFGFGAGRDGEAVGYLALSGELLCDEVVVVQGE
jgi:hypothetical protein